ncbi:hypothetical protein EHS25_008250 [Saitozyma podzolica]|uniref:Uncharacterized protein n=1 Tax=Saitozyma podzolica TaxID=1890683 RepID=A0A427YNW3_9TREE|nr:hypothetical protein EHS25_008250 [Saitozyma podzolica]
MSTDGMMFTPTAARRPRPPGSRSHRKPPPSDYTNTSTGLNATANANANATGDVTQSAAFTFNGDSNTTSTQSPTSSLFSSLTSSASTTSPLSPELSTPETVFLSKRQQLALCDLSRITASPAGTSEDNEEGDVSFGLDIPSPSSSQLQLKPQVQVQVQARGQGLGLGLPQGLSVGVSLNSPRVASAEAQPSPPPPYGQDLPDISDSQSQSQSQSRLDKQARARTQTPPMQDSGTSTRRTSSTRHVQDTNANVNVGPGPGFEVEERLRAKRATDAARAMGLEMDFGAGAAAEGESTEGSEVELNAEEVRKKLREVKKRLRQRDNELLMAAQVADKALRSHEAVVALLPTSTKSRVPHLVSLAPAARSRTHSRTASIASLSSPRNSHLRKRSLASGSVGSVASPAPSSPTDGPGPGLASRGSRHSPSVSLAEGTPPHKASLHRSAPHESTGGHGYSVHRRKVSRTKLFSSHSSGSRIVSPSHGHWSALQQAEQDERVVSLEQALAEARDSEEAQRKVAARLRKDVDKLQREFERTEERMVEVGTEKVFGIGTPREVVAWKPRDGTIGKGKRPNWVKSKTYGPDSTPDQQDRLGWGSTAFPEFPARPSRFPLRHRESNDQLANARARLARISMDTVRSTTPTHSPPTAGTQRSQPFPDVHELRSNLSMRSVDEVDLSSSDPPTPKSPAKPRERSISLTRREGRMSLRTADAQLRKKSSKGTFLSPAKALTAISPADRKHKGKGKGKGKETEQVPPSTPRVTIEPPYGLIGMAPRSDDSYRHVATPNSGSTRRSPSPFPRLSSISPVPAPSPTPARFSISPHPHVSPSPVRRLPTSPSARSASGRSLSMRSFSYRSFSPGFTALTSRMASMRDFVANNIQRTLGSELGSEFGDDWTSEADPSRLSTFAPPSWAASPASGRSERGDDAHEGMNTSLQQTTIDLNFPLHEHHHHDHDHDHEDEWTDEDVSQQYSYSVPAPLPPKVSAALSSLAIALAPSSVFAPPQDSSVPILPRGSLREEGLDTAAYDLLSEAVRLRRIRWADASPPRSVDLEATLRGGNVRPGPSTSTLASSISAFTRPVSWAADDPWEAEDYPDELSDASNGNGLRPSSHSRTHSQSQSQSYSRPEMARHGSSSTSSTIALAHRRLNSLSTSSARGLGGLGGIGGIGGLGLVASMASSVGTVVPNMTNLRAATRTRTRFGLAGALENEPSTIPGKMVNDVFVLFAILLEWMECGVIVILKLALDVRYRHRTT